MDLNLFSNQLNEVARKITEAQGHLWGNRNIPAYFCLNDCLMALEFVKNEIEQRKKEDKDG